MRSLKTLTRDDKGQAIVELSLVVALLFFLVLGVLEVGRIGHAYLTVVHASREGARLGVLGKSDTEIFEAVRRASGALPEEKLDIAVTPPASSRMRGTPLVVKVEYPVDLMAPIISNLLPNPFLVAGQTVMRIE